MKADDLVLDEGSQRQPIEELVDLIEDRVWLGGILSKSMRALLGKAESVVDPFVLVVTS